MAMKQAKDKEATKAEIPWDIVRSLLSPERLAKLCNYVAMYLAKHGKEDKAALQESEDVMGVPASYTGYVQRQQGELPATTPNGEGQDETNY